MKAPSYCIVLFATLFGGMAAFTPEAHAQGGLPLWTNRYNGPGNRSAYAAAIAMDSNGNVFVTGSASATNGVHDYVTIKYSGAGLPLWTNHYSEADTPLA